METEEEVAKRLICPHCKMDTRVRNPSGYCDHLYYPDNCEICKKIRYDAGYRSYQDLQDEIKKLKNELAEADKRLKDNMDICGRVWIKKCEEASHSAKQEVFKDIKKMRSSTPTAYILNQKRYDQLEETHVGKPFDISTKTALELASEKPNRTQLLAYVIYLEWAITLSPLLIKEWRDIPTKDYWIEQALDMIRKHPEIEELIK